MRETSDWDRTSRIEAPDEVRKALERELAHDWTEREVESAVGQELDEWDEEDDFEPDMLCDPKGYVLFRSQADFKRCPGIRIDQNVNLTSHLSEVSGYSCCLGNCGTKVRVSHVPSRWEEELTTVLTTGAGENEKAPQPISLQEFQLPL